MFKITEMWTRQEQIDALVYAYNELEDAAECFMLYLASTPPAASRSFAERMLKACRTDQGTVLDALDALRSGSWPIIFRHGVIRQLKTLALVANSMEILKVLDEQECAAIDAEATRLQNTMSIMDI